MSNNRGRILTFYSYKGGVGRTMLLINVAWTMASNGMKVLVVDWDLEAPGLNRYLFRFLKDPDLVETPGLLDLLIDFQLEALTPSPNTIPDWYHECINVKKYAVPIGWSFSSGGTIDLIGPGQQGPAYVQKLVSFDWSDFYTRFNGGAFFEVLKNQMRLSYDYVLIDSRAGVSDIAGVSTVQMPDDLVVCITMNGRSIEGAATITSSVTRQRELSKRPIRIFPVPSRVELTEVAARHEALEFAKVLFSQVTSHLDNAYWNDVLVPYLPYFAFSEVPAALAGNHYGEQLLASAARLTSYLTGTSVAMVNGIPEHERKSIINRS